MKKLTLVLALLMALLCLVACSTDELPDSDTTTTPVPDEPVKLISIVENNATQYCVVRPDDPSNEVVDAARLLHTAIIDKYGLSGMDISTDYVRSDTSKEDIPKYEILVGVTEREESIAALAEISYNDFVIRVMGTRIVIAGHTDEKTVEAVNYFIENYLTDDALILPETLLDISHADYAGEGVTLMGHPLSDYTLVYKGAYKYMAETIADELGMYTGVLFKMSSESNASDGPAIVIGSTTFGVKNDYAADSFSVTVGADGNVLLGGCGEWPTGSACRYFLNTIKAASGNIEASALDYLYIRPDRSEYINDISKLAMHWDILFDTPDWMLDYNEKYAAMSDPDGRLMSCLHRGDMVYYPENSIEGIISAIRMGGDMVEIDPRRTKDGVLVLMHDTTLTRTTNFSDMAGKDGLPTSANISDWTYEQLCRLSLKEAKGGADAALTEYKIPTLDEVMKVCAERIFVRLDKLDQWSYPSDIWPLITKYKAYTTVIFTWHSQFTSDSYRIIKFYKEKMIAACGRSSFSFISTDVPANGNVVMGKVNANGLDNCIRLTCNFSDITPENYLKKAESPLNVLYGKTRCYIDMNGSGAAYETEEYYKMLDEAGINVLLGDKGFRMCQYIAENYTATEY